MMIPSLLGAPSPAPWGHVIGATDPTQDLSSILSVKEYTVSGQKVWASYQCPPCNDAIIKLKKRLNAFAGLLHRNTLTVDGLVGDPTVASAKAVAAYALGNYATLQGTMLQAVARSKQALAEHAHYASELVRQIGQFLSLDVDRANVPVSPPPVPTPSQPSSPYPAPTTTPDLPPSFDPSMTTTSTSIFSNVPRWSLYLGGGILLAGLLTATVIVWRK